VERLRCGPGETTGRVWVWVWVWIWSWRRVVCVCDCVCAAADCLVHFLSARIAQFALCTVCTADRLKQSRGAQNCALSAKNTVTDFCATLRRNVILLLTPSARRQSVVAGEPRESSSKKVALRTFEAEAKGPHNLMPLFFKPHFPSHLDQTFTFAQFSAKFPPTRLICFAHQQAAPSLWLPGGLARRPNR